MTLTVVMADRDKAWLVDDKKGTTVAEGRLLAVGSVEGVMPDMNLTLEMPVHFVGQVVVGDDA